MTGPSKLSIVYPDQFSSILDRSLSQPCLEMLNLGPFANKAGTLPMSFGPSYPIFLRPSPKACKISPAYPQSFRATNPVSYIKRCGYGLPEWRWRRRTITGFVSKDSLSEHLSRLLQKDPADRISAIFPRMRKWAHLLGKLESVAWQAERVDSRCRQNRWNRAVLWKFNDQYLLRALRIRAEWGERRGIHFLLFVSRHTIIFNVHLRRRKKFLKGDMHCTLINIIE